MPTVNHANWKYYPDSTKKNGEIGDIFTKNNENEKVEDKCEDVINEDDDVEVFFTEDERGEITEIVKDLTNRKDVTDKSEWKETIIVQKQNNVYKASLFCKNNDPVKSKTQDAFEKLFRVENEDHIPGDSIKSVNKINYQMKRNKLVIADKTIKAKKKKLEVQRRVNKKREAKTNKKNTKRKDHTKWRLNSSMLATLVILNVTGHGKAVEGKYLVNYNYYQVPT